MSKISIPKAYFLHKAVASVDDSAKFTSFVKNLSSPKELRSLRKALYAVKKPFTCGWCPVHSKVHSDGDECENKCCQKSFGTGFRLKAHRTSHISKRPFMCEVCQKQFKDNDTLSRHRTSHSSQGCKKYLRYRCTECPQAFVRWKELREHRMEMHLGVQLFQCDECQQGLSCNQSSVDQRISRTTEEPHSCQYCCQTSQTKVNQNEYEGNEEYTEVYYECYEDSEVERMCPEEKLCCCEVCSESFTEQ